jgi:WD40 repeat protein
VFESQQAINCCQTTITKNKQATTATTKTPTSYIPLTLTSTPNPNPSRVATLDTLATSLTSSYLSGKFTSTTYPLPTYVRRISLSYPYVLCGLFDGSISLIDIYRNTVKFSTPPLHPQYKTSRSEDRSDPAITALHGTFDGGGVTAVTLSSDMKYAFTGGRDGVVNVLDLADKEDVGVTQKIKAGTDVVSRVLEGGGRVVTAAADEGGTVKIWEMGKGFGFGLGEGGLEEMGAMEVGSRVLTAEWR